MVLFRHYKQKTMQLKQGLVLTIFALIVYSPVWVWIVVAVSIWKWPFSLALWICYLTWINTAGFAVAESLSWQKLRWNGWKTMAEYFPAKLHKTTDLDPKKTYMFALAPHGVISISSWISFGTESTTFETLFPGINVRVLTLKHYLTTPGTREYVMLNGLRSASRDGVKNILSSGPGSAVLIVPGGAAEALLASPGTMDLVMAKRKGFVKLAIETGSCLVPVLAFGENELFDTYVPKKGSMTSFILIQIKRILGFSFPLFLGVGYKAGTWGTFPKQVPLNTVVGAPIEVPKYEPQSSKDEKMIALVDEYHAKFLEATQRLWDDHKDKFAVDRKGELCWVN